MPGEGLMLVKCYEILIEFSAFDTILSLVRRVDDVELLNILTNHLVINFSSPGYSHKVQVGFFELG